MTDRLEAALQQLSDPELEQVTQLAESPARAKEEVADAPSSRWKFDWVGALRDRPEESGVEAQRSAIREWTNCARQGVRVRSLHDQTT